MKQAAKTQESYRQWLNRQMKLSRKIEREDRDELRTIVFELTRRPNNGKV